MSMDLLEKIKASVNGMEDKVLKRIGEVDEKVMKSTGDYAVLATQVESIQKEIDEGTTNRNSVSVAGLSDELKKTKFSFTKVFHALAQHKAHGGKIDQYFDKYAPFEKDVYNETHTKALSEGVDTAGGFMVPIEVLHSEFIELLRDQLVLNKLGVRELTNLSGSPVQILGQSGGATAFWAGENEAITASQQSFDEKEMNPKRLGCLVKVSNRLLSLADGGIDQLIRQDMAAVMARAYESAVLYGVDLGASASGKRPRSLIATPGTQAYVIANPNGGVLDFDDIDAMVGLLEDNNSDQLGTPKLLMHNRVKRRLKKLKTAHYAGQSTEQPYLLGRPPVSDAELSSIMGYEFHTTNACPTNLVKGASSNLSYVIAAMWEEMITGWWRNMTFKTSNTAGDANGSAFTQNQTWLLAEMEVDSILRHEGAFVVASDAIA